MVFRVLGKKIKIVTSPCGWADYFEDLVTPSEQQSFDSTFLALVNDDVDILTEIFTKRLDEMENKLDKKVELDEVKALIQENKESAATGGNDQDGTLTSQLEEFKECMARKSNIIIFRAEESKKTEPKERKVEDMAIVNELCKITGTNKQTVKNVTRLGKKDVDSDNPRPMRVIFEDEKAKGSLMANMKNLATAEDKFKQLSITHDMTKKERLQNKEKLAEAKKKRGIGG